MLPAVLAGPGGAIFAWGIRRRKAKAERRRAARPAPQPAPPEFGQQPVGAGHHGVPNPHLQHDVVRRSVGGR
jgi:hypothetical protein